MGRFINADSYASTGQGVLGNNMFAYCNNNPVCYTDYTGEIATALIVAAGVAGGLWGLLTYLYNTENPTANDAIWAVICGAGSAIAGVYAGPADDIAKLSLSALSGVISAIPVFIDAVESGATWEDIQSSVFAAFASGTSITYLGAYIDTSIFQGLAEAAAIYDITILSGLTSSIASFPLESIFNLFTNTLTYAPNYSPTMYLPTYESGGIGTGEFFSTHL